LNSSLTELAGESNGVANLGKNVLTVDGSGLKTNREENSTKHVGFVYAYVKKAKNRKIYAEKGGDKQKNQDL